MPAPGRFAPAGLWRAFFVLGVFLPGVAGFAAVPITSQPDLAQIGKPDAAEAARLVEQFRNSGIPGEYYLDFELRPLLRKGEGKTFKGRWWGSRNDQGAITRIELSDVDGAAHRFVLQNGERAAVWRLTNGRPEEVGIADLMAPLAPGLELAAFDLQMPYLYWPNPTVEKITRVLGRPAHAFIFPAPAAFKAQYPEIAGVRAYLDTQFNVPMQVELIANDGRVIRTLALLSLKTVNKQTLPKAADYRNEQTRNKTRLQIIGAALDLKLPLAVFNPSTLIQPVSPPSADRIVRIDP